MFLLLVISMTGQTQAREKYNFNPGWLLKIERIF